MAQRISDEERARRQRAYEETEHDQAAALRMGLKTQTFARWRYGEGLPAKRPPGRAPYVSPQQAEVLEIVKAHPWSKASDLARIMHEGRKNIYHLVGSLEAKELVDCCLLGRIKHWAVHGVPLPKGGMKMQRMAPNPVYAGIAPRRVLEVLEEEPWLTVAMVQDRVAGVTSKHIESVIASLYRTGELRRHKCRMPYNRDTFAYALLSSPSFRGPHAVKIRRDMQKRTGYGLRGEAILKLLRRRPWRRVPQIAEELGVTPSGIYGHLQRLQEKGLIQKVSVWDSGGGRGRGTRFVYGLDGRKPPTHLRGLTVIPESSKPTWARVAWILEQADRPIPAETVQELYRRFDEIGERWSQLI